MTNTSKTESLSTESNEKDDGKSSRAQVPKKLMATAKDYIAAKVVLFSACQDDQKTAGIDNVRKLRLSFVPDGTKGGACTSLFLQVLYHDYKLRQEHDRRMGSSHNGDNSAELMDNTIVKPPSPMTYGKVLTHMQQVCERNNYTQKPLLSSSRPLQMNKDPFQIVPEQFRTNKTRNGTKRALIIGINYTNSPNALLGCHNDCRNVIAFLKEVHGFEDTNITLLLDDPVACDELHQPTKKNILRSFRNFAMQCKEEDVVFLHYAGHGISLEDSSGDEPDGFDEALMPVDYMTAGEIVDDEIFRLLLIPMPKNVVVTALFDCCHSGTILDLPFEYSVENPECDYDRVKFPHMHMVDAYRNRVAEVKKKQNLSDPRCMAKRFHSPMKHKPRGRSKTPRQGQRRTAKSFDPSMYRRRSSAEEIEEMEAPMSRSRRLDQQKPKATQEKTIPSPSSPEQKIGKPGSLTNAWKKVVSNPIGLPPKTPTKKMKKITARKENQSKRKQSPGPQQFQRRRSRSPKRRSKSQPTVLNSPVNERKQASKSKSPGPKLRFRRFFNSSLKSPKENTPTKLRRIPSPDSRMGKSPKAQQGQSTQQKKKMSRSLSPTKGLKPTKSSLQSARRPVPTKTIHRSPRSPKRGRHATTFESPRNRAFPPQIIEIPVL